MVGPARPPEIPPSGRAVGGEVDLAVVEFETAAALAPLDVALAATDDHHGPHFGGHVATEVRNRHETRS